MSGLRDTPQHAAIEAAWITLCNNLDHVPETDPDELVPRYWESRIALWILGFVREWDLPARVGVGTDALYEWLAEEHAEHARLLEEGRAPVTRGEVMTAPAPYVLVQPREHSDECRRGQDPWGPHYGLDRERCARCRNLWQRLEDVGQRRRQRG